MTNMLRYAAALLCCAWAASAEAQSAAEARLRDQLRATTTELRQAQDENSELKVKLQNLPQQAPAAAPPSAPAPAADLAKIQSLQAELRDDEAKSAAAQRQLDETQKALQQWQQSYAQLLTLAKTRDADAKKFEAQFQEADGSAKSCTQSNIKLVQLSSELLARYKKKNVWNALSNAEPLTGIQHVELEKISQDYHDRIVDATVKPAAPAPGTAQ